MPTMETGDVLAHETMGDVVEVGKYNKKLKVGDCVVVPFTSPAESASSARMAFIPIASDPIRMRRTHVLRQAIHAVAISARLDLRCLWRYAGQYSDGQRDQSEPHVNGVDAGPALHAEVDGAD